MELAPISPYGLKIIEEKIDTISWGDMETKSILFHSLLSELIRRKSSIFIAYDSQHFLMDGISNLSVDNNDPDFQEVVYQFIKSSMETDEASHQLKTYDLQQKRKWDNARSYGASFWGGKSLSWLMESFRESSSKVSADELLAVIKGYEYDYSYKEYKEILLSINEGIQLYEASFHFLDEHNLFNNSVFINEEGEFSTSVLLKYLSNFHSKAFVLSKSYSQFFGKVSKDRAALERKKIQDLSDKIEDLQYTFHQIPTNKLSKSTYGKWTTRCNDIKTEINEHFKLDLDLAKMYDEKDIIEETLNSLLKIVQGENKKVELKIRDYIKSINIKSHPDILISKIEKEINQLYKSINTSQIFEQQLENNSISSYKQFQQLKTLASTIVMAQNQLMNMGNYYNWKAFLVQLPKAYRNIIMCLKSIKKDQWLEAFQSWYFYKVIEKNRPFDQNESIGEDAITKPNVLQLQITQTRKNALLKLREQHPKLYNKLLKKSSRLTLDPQEQTQAELIGAFSIFKKADPTFSYSENDVIIDLSEQGIRIENADIYKFEAKPRSMYENGHLPFAQFVRGKLEAIDINEKLDVAKFLAGYLAKKMDRLELYLSKKANLILNVSSWKRQILQQEIGLDDLKKIRLSEPVSNGITEFMLNHSENMYYIYDDFYESQKNSWDYYKETQYLTALQNAGYKTIFLNSNSLMDQEDSYIDQLSEIQL